MAQARIVIADDHPALRRSLRELLEWHPGFRVVGEAATGSEAVAQVMQLRPDVAILDFRMPQMDGLEAAREIRSSCPNVAIFVISLSTDNQLGQRARESGVRAFFTKTRVPHELPAAIKAAVGVRKRPGTKRAGDSPRRKGQPTARRLVQMPSRPSVYPSKRRKDGALTANRQRPR